jgi:hypothetical protein
VSLDVVPHSDIILCRDLLVHLSFKTALKVLKNFQLSRAKFIILTTFTFTKNDTDIDDGMWRPVNMELPPFNFQKPTAVINEQCVEDGQRWIDKSLGLWNL